MSISSEKAKLQLTFHLH